MGLPTLRFVSFIVSFTSKGFQLYITRSTIFTFLVSCLERPFLIKIINTLFHYFCSELFLLKIIIHLKSGFLILFYFIVSFFDMNDWFNLCQYQMVALKQGETSALLYHDFRRKKWYFKNSDYFMTSWNNSLKIFSQRLDFTPPPRSSLMRSILSAVEGEPLMSTRQVAESSLSSSFRWMVIGI